jgi:hypothetical protein
MRFLFLLFRFRYNPYTGRDLDAVDMGSGVWIACKCRKGYTCGACEMHTQSAIETLIRETQS